VFGGDEDEMDNKLWSYDAATNSWFIVPTLDDEEGESLKPQRYATLCGSKVNGRLVLISGVYNAAAIGGIWRMDAEESSWSKVPLMPSEMELSERWIPQTWCDSDSGVLYLFGGYLESNQHERNYPSGMWRFNISSLVFEQIEVNGSSPSLRYGGATWISVNDSTLWLFGGRSVDGAYNDLWQFDISRNEWKEIQRPEMFSGLFGELGVMSNESHPGARTGAFTWVDECGNLWLFGGSGYGMSAHRYWDEGSLNDLWVYVKHENVWVWMGGNKVEEGNGKYGKLMSGSSDFFPSPRYVGASWSVNNAAYLFGGQGHNVKGSDASMNDLWQIDMGSQCNWTFSVSNDSEIDVNPVETGPIDHSVEPTDQLIATMQAEHPTNNTTVNVVNSSKSVATDNNPASSVEIHLSGQPATDSNTSFEIESTSSEENVLSSETPDQLATQTDIQPSSKTSDLITNAVSKPTSQTKSESTLQSGLEPTTKTGDTLRISSKPANESQINSTNNLSASPTSQTPMYLVSEVGSESAASTASTAIDMSSQSGNEITTQIPIKTDSELSNESTDQMSMGSTATSQSDIKSTSKTTTNTPTEAVSKMSSESVTQDRAVTQSQSPMTTMPGSEPFTQTETSHTSGSKTKIKPTVQSVSELSSPSIHESTSQLPTETASQPPHTTTKKSAAGIVTFTPSTEPAETQTTNIHGSSESSHKEPAVESTGSPSKEFRSKSSKLEMTKLVPTDSSKAVEVGSTEPLPSGLQTEHSSQTQQSTSEPSTTDAIKSSKFRSNLHHSQQPTVQSSSDWSGSRKLVPVISVGLILFALLLFAAGVFLGRPYCRRKQKSRRYNYQKVASDDVTEWQ
jgi:hypothetical protein